MAATQVETSPAGWRGAARPSKRPNDLQPSLPLEACWGSLSVVSVGAWQ